MSLKDLAWNSVVGKGNNFDVGPANYLLRSSTPGGPIQDTFDTAAYRAARDFLGMGHYDCVLCHNGQRHGTYRTKTTILAIFDEMSR